MGSLSDGASFYQKWQERVAAQQSSQHDDAAGDNLVPNYDLNYAVNNEYISEDTAADDQSSYATYDDNMSEDTSYDDSSLSTDDDDYDAATGDYDVNRDYDGSVGDYEDDNTSDDSS